MANAVFSCPKCLRALGDVPASGRLVAVCPRCRLKYEVVHGRVSDVASRRMTIREPIGQYPGAYAERHDLRLDLPDGRAEAVTYDLPDGDDTAIQVRPGDLVYAIYLMRSTNRDELLTVHNATTGRSLGLALPGDKAAGWSWTLAAIGAVLVLFLLSSAGTPGGPSILVGLATFLAAGFGLRRWFMPRADISPEEIEQVTATHRLIAEKLNVETARSRTVREMDSRRELRDRLIGLRSKMVAVGLDLYKPRIAALDRAIELTDSQLGLEARLRAGYERSIQMIEIEIEAGATADALDAAASPHIAASLAEMRDLEEQQAELARQLAANVEVEAILKSGSA